VVADGLCWQPTRSCDVWHDRAVFHFLVEPGDHDRYLDTVSRAVPVGAALVIGTFAVGGPTRCSGLPTARYDPDTLGREFAPAFVREHSESGAAHHPQRRYPAVHLGGGPAPGQVSAILLGGVGQSGRATSVMPLVRPRPGSFGTSLASSVSNEVVDLTAYRGPAQSTVSGHPSRAELSAHPGCRWSP
jgi:hypothetical protein